MKTKRRDFWLDLLCLLPVMAWVLAYSYPYFFESLSDNYRQIQTYNLDSMVMLRAVEEGLSSRWFQFRFIEYGHFYFNLAMATAALCARFAHLSEWGLFFILRLYSLLGGCATIIVTFLFAKRYLGRPAAIFAAVLLAFSPRFIEFSNEVKPDTWQVCFIMLSLYFLARAFEPPAQDGILRRPLRATFGFVLAASAAAGAAFGTKYQGILLIPLLAWATWMVRPDQIGERFFTHAMRLFVLTTLVLATGLFMLGRNAYPLNVMLFLQPSGTGAVTRTFYWVTEAGRVTCFLAAGLCLAAAAAFLAGFDFERVRTPIAVAMIWICSAMAFAAAFALTSPWLMYHLQFVPNLYQRSDIVGAGQWFGFRWLQMIFGIGASYPELFLNHEIGALSVLGAALLLLALARRKVDTIRLAFLLVLAFAVIFITMLVTKINFVTSLYPLQTVPALVLLAAFALHEIGATLQGWLGARAALVTVILAVLLAATQVWQGGSQLLQYPLLVKALTPGNRMMGAWLERCAPSDAKMLAAAYSYVPPHIDSMIVNWGPDYRYLVSSDPEIVSLNLDDAASEAKAAARPGYVPSDLDRFYDAVLRSGAWRGGPIFVPYRIYVKSTDSRINLACH